MPPVQRLLPVLFAAAVILACGLPSIGIPVGLATASLQPASTDTQVPAGTMGSPESSTSTSVSYGNLRLVIPDGLSTGTTNTTGADIELPYTNPSNGDMPQHIKIVINGYPIQGTNLPPQVVVFSAAQYAQYGPLTQQIISTLQGEQFQDGQPLPAALPDGAFNAHVGAVNFANGRGIRYLTQFDQAPLPVNNLELIYYFQGLTNDRSMYVQVILPVQASFLAPDDDPSSPLPSGGIPFNTDDPGGYYQAIADKLNATPPDQFTPSLSVLDALVQSIAVK